MKKEAIGVLGIGAMGEIIAKDLLKTYKGKIILLGHNQKNIKKVFKNTETRYANVSDVKSLTKALKGINTVIHAVHHEFNINVMTACLKTKTNYVDLGGLYYYTKKQLKLNNKFKKEKLTAVIGMGAAPGITNILAKYTSNFLDKIYTIDIKLGSKDFSKYKQESPLSNSYSIQTILEEFSWKPAVYINNNIKFIKSISGREEYKFPKPVGIQKPQYTIHSELATLPYTLKARNVSFKIAFDDNFVNKIITLKKLNLISDKKVKINNKEFIINSISTRILKGLPKTIPDKIKQYEIIRVITKGEKSNKNKTIVIDAHVKGIGESIDKDTGVPPSIVAQMIVNNEINKKGVFPPELIIPEISFFKKLTNRNIYIYKNNKKLKIGDK